MIGDEPEAEKTLKELIAGLPWFGRLIIHILGGVFVLLVLFCAAFVGIELWKAIQWAW